MKVPLLGGAYSARSYVANAQRCVNLFPEKNTQDAEQPTTHYLTPGSTLLAQAAFAPWRGLYTATNKQLYGVCGATVYLITNNWSLTVLGTLSTSEGQVYMVDNGNTLVITDGSLSLGQLTFTGNVFTVATPANYLGAARCAYVDTFLLFNQVGTKNFFSSLSNEVAFDPLYVAAKTGFPDKLTSVVTNHREVLLIGERTMEVWYNAGSPNFPFDIVPGVFIQHGTVAPNSISWHDLYVLWLSLDAEGHLICVMYKDYKAGRVSTFAMEQEWSRYATVSDAIGMMYQQQGHTFYQLTFPSANKTWVLDVTEGEWHERTWTDPFNGTENRHRANCMAFAYGKNVFGDFENGALCALDIEEQTDLGVPIVRRRGFPHLVNEGDRTYFTSFIADLQASGDGDEEDPQLFLRMSNDRGKSFGNPVVQGLGGVGNYLAQPQWNRLGYARDRVFELFWSSPVPTALNGAYVQGFPGQS